METREQIEAQIKELKKKLDALPMLQPVLPDGYSIDENGYAEISINNHVLNVACTKKAIQAAICEYHAKNPRDTEPFIPQYHGLTIGVIPQPQPISTVPKDSTYIFVYDALKEIWCRMWFDQDEPIPFKYTHWLPMPQPPKID